MGQDPSDIREEMEQTRAETGRTVDALAGGGVAVGFLRKRRSRPAGQAEQMRQSVSSGA
jgi:hypothetical protein